ncbi:hypothetical protein MMC12_008443 [Toensbergia leucococca]|nr:hypothetical protein [Toensbergia leucococca]
MATEKNQHSTESVPPYRPSDDGSQKEKINSFAPAYFLQTLWLFTLSNLKTFVYPETAFGFLSALSGPMMTTNAEPHLFTIIARLPLVLLWTWLNTLIFDLANQRLPDSILTASTSPGDRSQPAESAASRLDVSY